MSVKTQSQIFISLKPWGIGSGTLALGIHIFDRTLSLGSQKFEVNCIEVSYRNLLTEEMGGGNMFLDL
jgi:hypothetical protein